MEAVYAVLVVGKGKKVARESEGGFIEERHVQRIERDRELDGTVTAGGRSRG